MTKNIFLIILIFSFSVSVFAENQENYVDKYKKMEKEHINFVKKCYIDKKINTKNKLKSFVKKIYRIDLEEFQSMGPFYVDPEYNNLSEVKRIYGILKNNPNDICMIDYLLFYYDSVDERLESLFNSSTADRHKKDYKVALKGMEYFIQKETRRIKKQKKELKTINSL